MYNIAHTGGTGAMKVLDQPIFNSIQPRTRFQLQTSQPGRVYYEVKQIGDAAYPLSKHKNAVIPRSERLLFEQQVSMRPTARFSNRNRLSYCLNDTFVPLDFLSADGTVVFDGTPPFSLKLSIKNLGASHVDETTVEVSDLNWKIDLPAYNFKSIGPHLLTIESVRDASNCAPAPSDPLSRSIWVDVAETAAIIPFDRREHFCVGEISQFQLEGIPPWSIGQVIMFFFLTNVNTATPTVIASMANRIHKRPEFRPSPYFRNSQEISQSRPLLINRNFAKQLLRTCDFVYTRFRPLKLVMARESIRTSMKVRAGLRCIC